MRLGIVSDTHNNLKNCREIVAVFNDTGVDQVIHTGDITQAKTLDVLSGLTMPLSGVFGNNDIQERKGLLLESNKFVRFFIVSFSNNSFSGV